MLKNSLESYVVSTRIRLARNLAGYPFVSLMRQKDVNHLTREVTGALEMQGLSCTPLALMSELEAQALCEQHLISPALIANREGSAVALDTARQQSVMINEEDHLRIQCILSGLELDRAYATACGLDDYLSDSLQYSFDERLGYLTACPTNLGTGMRAGVMMFLPGLNLSGRIAEMSDGGALGNLTFRGVYGEGSQAEGFLYQLSNRHTLGLSEQEILQEVREGVDYIASLEEQARESLYAESASPLTDRVWRAWGLLTNSFLMPSSEFVAHLAFVKLGASLGLIKLRDEKILDRMTVECQRAVLLDKREVDETEENTMRAAKLRNALTPLRIS